VQRGLLLDVVVGQGAAVLQLLARKDQALLVRGDTCRNKAQDRSIMPHQMVYMLSLPLYTSQALESPLRQCYPPRHSCHSHVMSHVQLHCITYHIKKH
jgi:hypothetical protein